MYHHPTVIAAVNSAHIDELHRVARQRALVAAVGRAEQPPRLSGFGHRLRLLRRLRPASRPALSNLHL
jgi:hypothetical protein